MCRLFLLTSFLFQLQSNWCADALPVEEITQGETKEKLELLKLTEQELILTCTILAAGIFVLVCIFGLFICFSEINEVKGVKRSPSAELHKMATLKTFLQLDAEPKSSKL